MHFIFDEHGRSTPLTSTQVANCPPPSIKSQLLMPWVCRAVWNNLLTRKDLGPFQLYCINHFLVAMRVVAVSVGLTVLIFCKT